MTQNHSVTGVSQFGYPTFLDIPLDDVQPVVSLDIQRPITQKTHQHCWQVGEPGETPYRDPKSCSTTKKGAEMRSGN